MPTRTVASARSAAGARTVLAPYTPLQPNDASIVANLGLWLKADAGVYSDLGTTPATNGQTVEQWNDQSGNGNNAIQTTAGNRPTLVTNVINSLPVLRFANSGSKFLAVTNQASISPANGITLFVVHICNDQTLGNGGVQGIVVKDISTGITNPPYGFEISSPRLPAFITQNPSNVAGNASGGGYSSGTAYISRCLFDGSTVYLYINTVQSLTSHSQTALAQSTGNLNIGQQKAGSSRFFDGDIAEIILYNTGLSLLLCRQIEAYLTNKYGISTADQRGVIA